MESLPVLIVTALGVVGLCLMMAAFVLIVRSPRFADPSSPEAARHALRVRRLLVAGAGLGVLFGLLLLVPGVLPWVNSPSSYAELWTGAATGAVVAAIILYSTWAKSRRSSGTSAER